MIRDGRLKPETSVPKKILAIRPPIKAPAIPSRIAPKIPPLELSGKITFAIAPAIPPNMIHVSMFMSVIIR